MSGLLMFALVFLAIGYEWGQHGYLPYIYELDEWGADLQDWHDDFQE